VGQRERVADAAQVDEPHHRCQVVHVLVERLEDQAVGDERVDHGLDLARQQGEVTVQERLAAAQGLEHQVAVDLELGVKTTPSGPFTVPMSSRETVMSRIPPLTGPSAPTICSIREAGSRPPFAAGAARAPEAKPTPFPRIVPPTNPPPSASARRRLSRVMGLGSTLISSPWIGRRGTGGFGRDRPEERTRAPQTGRGNEPIGPRPRLCRQPLRLPSAGAAGSRSGWHVALES
jgi:hypothetical protein